MGRLRLALAERYAVERMLGQGGSAVVCLAQDLRHSRPVAIKVLRPEIALLIGRDRFLHEIETVARLQHPHILPLYDSGEADGLLYFVMPYVQGQSLRDLLEREKQLSVEDAVSIARDIASALAFAHEHGVVHRDIKPENVMLFGGAAVVADFGIARVLHAAGDSRMTEGGLALGTPLYMSPEQAAASGEVDARSDQYGLACVLYEMLGGTPPFTGISPSDVLAHHVHQALRPITELRSSVPPALALAVSKALSKLPADRFRTVTDFADALRTEAGVRVAFVRSSGMRRGMAWAAAVAVVAVAAVLARRLVAAGSLDQSRYVVLPLTEESTTASPEGLRGEHTAMLLRGALSRWRDVNVVSDVLVNDAASSTGNRTLSFREALDSAKRLGAGRLVWGGQYPDKDSVRMSIGLYDVAHGGRKIRESGFTIARDLSDLSAKVGAVADSLVADRVTLRFGAAPIGTASREAWNAYAAGHSALSRWDLALAASSFDRAATLDRQFALALFWLAQVRAWQRLPEELWQRPARSAVTLADHLVSARDSDYAEGLLALAERRYPDACRRYRNVLDRDSTDIVALLGLGECNYRDRAVVRSRLSPTTWAFRGSVATAIRAYSSALELAPAFNFTFGSEAYQRLSAMFYVERNQFRSGLASPPDTGRFAAFASLRGDTLVFVPDRWRVTFGRARPAGLDSAIAINREQLRRVVGKWLQDYPSRSEPHATLALMLELGGTLGPAMHGEATALGEIVEARRLATDSLAALKHATTQVRLFLKSLQVPQARSLTDSLLAAWPRPTAGAAEHLAGLAALVGHAGQAASLSVLAESTLTGYQRLLPGRAPLEVIATVRRMNSYVGFGGPRDSLVQLADRVNAQLVRFVEPKSKDAVWYFLMDDPLALAFLDMPQPRSHPRDHGNSLLEIEDLIAHGDSAGALRLLHGGRGERAPGTHAAVTALATARLMLALRDSAGATELLLGVLDNIQVAPTLLIDEPLQSASLVRAMALAAELSARRGDGAAARRWAARVIQLWSDCDAPCQPVVGRMRALLN